MKITLPKTVRLLALQEYDPENTELAGVVIHVWVDPPRAVAQEYDRINSQFAALLKQATGKPGKKATFWELLAARRKLAHKPPTKAYREAIFTWYARMWSQGPDGTHWEARELRDIDEHNPAFLEWLERGTWALIERHRSEIKKGLRPQAPTPPATEERATQP